MRPKKRKLRELPNREVVKSGTHTREPMHKKDDICLFPLYPYLLYSLMLTYWNRNRNIFISVRVHTY